MSEVTALAVVPPEERGEKPSALMQRASDVAGVCREIVMRTAMELQGKKYVKVEGWQCIAAAYGIPSIREVVEEEKGIRAVAELRRHDGTVLATAEGYCGLDEPRWSSQPMYARRGMASTRAISRVCRSAFAFCVVLIDSNLQTTPAEEIPHEGFSGTPAPQVVNSTSTTAAPRPAGPAPERSKATQVKFGKSKGKYLYEIEDADLQWQLNAARKSVEANDPKWGEANKAWLATVQAEVSRRGLDF
jgi:hypothetical protein